ncbi:DMT family transporter [Phytohalomonas tamaricis]|uniref:DMT family transporter n=1 Tax=Phytohalomonas tamaricis TaxID=2081032 RepID=UPI000D0B02A3|nr:EamA family transporter [Phytohalomonas tamaricis]
MALSDAVRLLMLSAMWGASFLFMRIAAPVLDAIPTAFFRALFATLALIALLLVMRSRWVFRGKFGLMLLIGALNSGVPFALYCTAAKLLPAGYSAIFNATTPMMGVLIGAVFFHESLTFAKALGVVLGLGGVAILVNSGPVAVDGNLLLGALACLGAATCYGLSGFLIRRWITQKGGLDSRLQAVGSQVGATLVLLPFFAIEVGRTSSFAHWHVPQVWGALAILGIVCTALAYILFFQLIANVGPIKAYTVTLLVPPFGVLWGALLLDEKVTLAHFGGGVLIAMSLWLILYNTQEMKTVTPVTEERT